MARKVKQVNKFASNKIEIRVLKTSKTNKYDCYTIETNKDNVVNKCVASAWFKGKPNSDGCDIEDLIDICIHRLESFQKGKFPCEENNDAIFYLMCAMEALNSRTEDRRNRGVEGKYKA